MQVFKFRGIDNCKIAKLKTDGSTLEYDEIIDLFLPVLFYRVRLRRVRKRLGASRAIESPEPIDAGDSE